MSQFRPLPPKKISAEEPVGLSYDKAAKVVGGLILLGITSFVVGYFFGPVAGALVPVGCGIRAYWDRKASKNPEHNL